LAQLPTMAPGGRGAGMFRVDMPPAQLPLLVADRAHPVVDRTVGDAWRVAADPWGNSIALQERIAIHRFGSAHSTIALHHRLDKARAAILIGALSRMILVGLVVLP
jgi:hypothetical protein